MRLRQRWRRGARARWIRGRSACWRYSAGRRARRPEELEELALFRRLQPALEEGIPLKRSLSDPEERRKLSLYGFLSLKPTLSLQCR